CFLGALARLGVALRLAFARALDVGRVPAASFELKAGGRDQLGQRVLAALGTGFHGRSRYLLQVLCFAAAGSAAVFVNRHGKLPEKSMLNQSEILPRFDANSAKKRYAKPRSSAKSGTSSHRDRIRAKYGGGPVIFQGMPMVWNP